MATYRLLTTGDLEQMHMDKSGWSFASSFDNGMTEYTNANGDSINLFSTGVAELNVKSGGVLKGSTYHLPVSTSDYVGAEKDLVDTSGVKAYEEKFKVNLGIPATGSGSSTTTTTPASEQPPHHIAPTPVHKLDPQGPPQSPTLGGGSSTPVHDVTNFVSENGQGMGNVPASRTPSSAVSPESSSVFGSENFKSPIIDSSTLGGQPDVAGIAHTLNRADPDTAFAATVDAVGPVELTNPKVSFPAEPTIPANGVGAVANGDAEVVGPVEITNPKASPADPVGPVELTNPKAPPISDTGSVFHPDNPNVAEVKSEDMFASVPTGPTAKVPFESTTPTASSGGTPTAEAAQNTMVTADAKLDANAPVIPANQVGAAAAGLPISAPAASLPTMAPTTPQAVTSASGGMVTPPANTSTVENYGITLPGTTPHDTPAPPLTTLSPTSSVHGFGKAALD